MDLYILAESGGRVVGIASLDGTTQERFGHGVTPGLGVCREHWRRGVGSALPCELLEWADARGIVRVALEVVESTVHRPGTACLRRRSDCGTRRRLDPLECLRMSASGAARDEAYQDLLRTARRLARSAEEACDLVQDVLVIALSNGEDWRSPLRRPWLRGVVRKRAAFLARGQLRRRRREALVELSGPGSGAWTWQPRFLASLPRSLRAVATLASADLCAAEIRWLLGLSSTALRQRLSELRRAVRAEAEPPTQPAPEPAVAFGAHRASLLAVLRRQDAPALATHDPDGHAILLRVSAHKPRPIGNR